MQDLKEIKTIGVIGSGLMGSGIALVSAQAGYAVVLFDIKQELLDKAKKSSESFLSKSVEKGLLTGEQKDKVLGAIRYTTSLEEMKADFVVEAIPENLELKREVLKKVETLNEGKAILASNTSTIPITRIAAGLSHPENVVGMHFFNPPTLMKLVEVIRGAATDEKVAVITFGLSEKLGKKPVYVKDEPGFIVNRVARHFYLESLRLLEENVASVETIDNIMENTGFRMGPFKLMDLIGVETNHEVTKSLYNAFFQEPKFRPSRIQQNKVDAGHFGRKSGKGFYNY